MKAREVDVVVVGGGIVGAASAYYLAKGGAKVALLEKGTIACEQSSRNWGFVRVQGRDPFEIPLAIESVRLWQGLEAELGADLEWRQEGGLAVAANEASIAAYERWLEAARPFQLPTRIIGNREIRGILQGAQGTWPGAMYNPSDGQAEPAKVAPAFAEAARRLGAEVVAGCAFDAIDRAGGRVVGVRTERGEVRARTVVCAAGAWASRLLATIGVAMPQLAVRGTVARTGPVRAISGAGVWAPELAFRQRRDGTLNIVDGDGGIQHDVVPASLRWAREFSPLRKALGGHAKLAIGAPLVRGFIDLIPGTAGNRHPFRAVRINDPPARTTHVANAVAGLAKAFPDLGPVEVTRTWAGYIDLTPDFIPVLGPVADVPGLVIAAGMSGHGFMLGPVAGRIVADVALKGHTMLEIAPFRLSRFADGTSLGPRLVI
jgi:glycine/D-amino acid oxidase-like deaminating enzyme